MSDIPAKLAENLLEDAARYYDRILNETEHKVFTEHQRKIIIGLMVAFACTVTATVLEMKEENKKCQSGKQNR